MHTIWFDCASFSFSTVNTQQTRNLFRSTMKSGSGIHCELEVSNIPGLYTFGISPLNVSHGHI